MVGAKYFEVKLTRSIAGRPDAQRRVALGLGLGRGGRQVVLKDTPAIRGMIAKVVHLVTVTPKQGQVPPTSARARARAEKRG
ncbi:MAG: 50S ribosomal protein L30 [Myxococcota bacterium]